MLYLIKLLNQKISLSEYDSDTKSFLKITKNGEVWQEFNESSFWKWFKKKLDYENEKLSFVIISDIKNFTIDSTIELAKTNFIKNKQIISQLLTNEIVANTKFYFIPHVDYTTPTKVTIKQKAQPPKKESLSEYYTNKTKLLREL